MLNKETPWPRSDARDRVYAHGRGVPQDDSEAAKWFRLAAEQGVADAQSNLGIVYANGLGVPQDDSEAAKWYRLAAEGGDPIGQINLGVAYANGQGVTQDYSEAVKWFRLAAEQGVAQAQNLEIMSRSQGYAARASRQYATAKTIAKR